MSLICWVTFLPVSDLSQIIDASDQKRRKYHDGVMMFVFVSLPAEIREDNMWTSCHTTGGVNSPSQVRTVSSFTLCDTAGNKKTKERVCGGFSHSKQSVSLSVSALSLLFMVALRGKTQRHFTKIWTKGFQNNSIIISENSICWKCWTTEPQQEIKAVTVNSLFTSSFPVKWCKIKSSSWRYI